MMPVEFHLVLTSLMRMRHWSSGVPDTYMYTQLLLLCHISKERVKVIQPNITSICAFLRAEANTLLWL